MPDSVYFYTNIHQLETAQMRFDFSWPSLHNLWFSVERKKPALICSLECHSKGIVAVVFPQNLENEDKLRLKENKSSGDYVETGG